MVYEPCSNDKDSLFQQRFYGKIQYMRNDHGYIRSKLKIHGVRDITFNYLDMPRDVQQSLEIGDPVSFRVNFFSSGKFCAIDVQKESSLPDIRSDSPLSISSTDTIVDAGYNRVSEKKDHACWSISRSEMDRFRKPDNDFVIPSLDWSMDQPRVEKDPFSVAVDTFMEKVISRQYNASYTTCWLQF